MGTLYQVACLDCKVTRDLDKYYDGRICENRKEALAYSKFLEEKKNLFRAGLLLSFLNEHMGHKIVHYNEHHEDCCDLYDPDLNNSDWVEEPVNNGFEFDHDFWTKGEDEI